MSANCVRVSRLEGERCVFSSWSLLERCKIDKEEQEGSSGMHFGQLRLGVTFKFQSIGSRACGSEFEI